MGDINFSILNAEKIIEIHEASMHILEKIGMKVEGGKIQDLLKRSGINSDSNGRIKFSREIVEDALRAAPKYITLYTREGEPYMTVPDSGKKYFGTHADQLEILDPFIGANRKFIRSDIKMMCLIADYLPTINFILTVGLSSDVPPEIQSQISFLETVKNFRKPINFSSNNIQALKDIIEVSSDLAGGITKLQEKPFIFHYCEPIPPLYHPETSTEKIYLSAEKKIPLVYMPYCMMGATAAMSLSGALAQCNAEVLAGLVMSQLVNEGAPFIYGAMPSIFDMKTTIGSYGSPEFHLQIAASSELAAFYGLPFYGTAGCSDARVIDEQAVAEVSIEIFSALLSRADLVHDVGVMDHCNSISPEMLILADEIISYLNSYLKGIIIDDLPLALEDIADIGPAGNFLGTEYTMQNFRNIWYPKLANRNMINKDTSDVRAKIRILLNHITKNHEAPIISNNKSLMLAEYEKEIKSRYF
ncbi:MAG: trimethylamine methyltransferase family protein [Bacillota bacterium]|nr:trimethylamine methyltransferase family protein [Bacillota bacterium]